ncbi:methyl-accepting chemotaxis protein, partial [Helicobacter didelphidarum]
MNFFSHLKIGTKIILAIILTVFLCLGALVVVVSSHSSKILSHESEKLIINVGKRAANLVEGYLRESRATLNLGHAEIQEALLHGYGQTNDTLLETTLINMLDKNTLGIFGYIYLKNIHLQNSRYHIGNDSVILGHDSQPAVEGGVQLTDATQDVLNLRGLQQAMQTGKMSVGKPVKMRFNGIEVNVLSINIPFFDSNHQVVGSIGLLLDINTLAKVMNDSSRLSVFEGDYRAILTSDGTIITNPNPEFIGMSLLDANRHPSATEVVNAIKRKQEGVMPYNNLQGDISYTANAFFNITDDVYWSVLVTAPEKAIFAPLSQLQTYMFVGSLIAIFIVCAIVYFVIRSNITMRIHTVQSILFGFFKYLNHESKNPPKLVHPRAQDEIGAMAIAINENIEKTQQSLKQDTIAIEQSAKTA